MVFSSTLNTTRAMVEMLVRKAWNHRREFAKYFLTGISAFIVDIGSLFVLKKIFGLNQVTAVAMYQPIVILYVFFLNKRWSFQVAGQTHRQLIKFILLAIINYIISIAWMWLLSHEWGVHYQIARVSNIILSVSWNFLAYKYWVYR